MNLRHSDNHSDNPTLRSLMRVHCLRVHCLRVRDEPRAALDASRVFELVVEAVPASGRMHADARACTAPKGLLLQRFLEFGSVLRIVPDVRRRDVHLRTARHAVAWCGRAVPLRVTVCRQGRADLPLGIVAPHHSRRHVRRHRAVALAREDDARPFALVLLRRNRP